MVTLTFTLTGVTSMVGTLTVNSDTYTYSDFTNNSLSLEFTSGTNILWTASGLGKFSAYPSSGSLTLSENTTVTIDVNY